MVTRWVLLNGAEKFRVMGGLRALSGAFGGKLSYRSASVVADRPGAWTDSATARTSEGVFCEDFTVSGTTNALWIQARWAGAASTGVAEALGSLSAMADAEPAPLLTARVEVEPTTNSGQTAVVVVGGRHAALGLAGVMAGFRVYGLSGTLAYGLCMRSYTTEDADPSSWTDLATYSNVTADEYRNSGDLTVSPGTNAQVEFGLKLSGDAKAAIDVVLAGRWS